MSALLAGARVELVVDVDRYPHFIAPVGSTGTVVDHGDPSIVLAVRLDEPLAGAEDWDNEVHWFAGDAELNELDVYEYLALYIRPIDNEEGTTSPMNESDYVNHDALRAMSTNELAGLVNEGGPAALIDAAELELERRNVSAAGELAYEIASADVVLPLSSDDAAGIASALELLAEVAELEDLERDDVVRLAGIVRAHMRARS